MTKIIHTSDWQLGMTRHFLDDDAQARFSEARNDAIRRIGALAQDESAVCIVVAGDVFDSNHVDRRTVTRALDAMREVRVPIYLLPGNHDPLDLASVYRSKTFLAHSPENVHILESGPIRVTDDLELVGAPWHSKRPLEDLVARRMHDLEPPIDSFRVLVAHGGVDALSPDRDDPSLVRLADAESGLQRGVVHYIALGDKHSTQKVGSSGCIWYSGAPEPTAYDEADPGNVLIVDIGDQVDVRNSNVGCWKFIERTWQIDGSKDLDLFDAWLDGMDDRARTLLKLSFVGTVNLQTKARLDDLLEHQSDVYAAIEVWARRTDLAVYADDADLSKMNLAGFAKTTLQRLADMADGQSETAQRASDALGLLFRLAGGGGR